MEPQFDLAAARRRMIEQHLKARGINSTQVLDAMNRVPRELFVPAEFAAEAYSDQALAIDCGQTISQPYIVALMSEALELSGTEHVLEIGTGSGYQTAILAELAGDVVTVERHERLQLQAQQILRDRGYNNIRFIVADGSQGWPAESPYDRIIVTAAATQCPPVLLEQLRDGGILVGPFGPSDGQILQAIRKIGERTFPVALTPCRFVPLVGHGETPL
jgi:protein-L-isoaspartate(D-aspartate) O-methyltransferase